MMRQVQGLLCAQNKSEWSSMSQKNSDLRLVPSQEEAKKLRLENDKSQKRLNEMVSTIQKVPPKEKNETRCDGDQKVEKSNVMLRGGDVMLRGGDVTPSHATDKKMAELDQVVATQKKIEEALAKDVRNNEEVSKSLGENTKSLKELTHKLGEWKQVIIFVFILISNPNFFPMAISISTLLDSIEFQVYSHSKIRYMYTVYTYGRIRMCIYL